MAEKIIKCFFNKELAERFLDSKVIEATGKNTTGWVCPTHPQVLQELCIDLDVDTIILDFCHYPTNWQSQPIELLDTCYCDRCLKLFSDYIGESISGQNLEEKVLLIDGSYYIEWMEFKMKHITNFVKNFKKQNVTLKIRIPPWENKENGEGMKRLLGIDLNSLSSIIDVFQIPLHESDPKAQYFKDNLMKVEFISPVSLT